MRKHLEPTSLSFSSYRIPLALSVFLCFMPSLAMANNTDTNTGSYFPKHCVFSAKFSQQMLLSGVPEPLTASGTMFFDCQKGLIWQTLTPQTETFVYTKTSQQYRITESTTEKIQKSRLHRNLGKLLNGLMSGDSKYLKRYFTLQTSTESSTKTGNHDILTPETEQTFSLIPRRKQMAKFISALNIAKTPEKVSINWESNIGDKTQISISNIIPFAEFNIPACQNSVAATPKSCLILAE